MKSRGNERPIAILTLRGIGSMTEDERGRMADWVEEISFSLRHGLCGDVVSRDLVTGEDGV
jgi:hypothetical protein